MQNAVEKKRTRVIGPTSLALSFVLCGSLPAFAQVVKLVGEGRVTVHADGVILVNMLRELDTVIPIEQLLLDPAVDGKMVRVELEDVPFREALEEVLSAAEVNHVVWGREEGPFRIFAGSAQQTRLVPLSERSAGFDTAAGAAGQPDSSQPPGQPDSSQPPGQFDSSQPPGQFDSSQPPARPRRPASGEAFLPTPPEAGRFAATLAILLTGLLSGSWLVRDRRPSSRARSRDTVRIERSR